MWRAYLLYTQPLCQGGGKGWTFGQTLPAAKGEDGISEGRVSEFGGKQKAGSRKAGVSKAIPEVGGHFSCWDLSGLQGPDI
jgi:hypothetical protein